MQHNGVLKQEGEGKTTTPQNHPPRSWHRLTTILAKTEKRAWAEEEYEERKSTKYKSSGSGGCRLFADNNRTRIP
jgi:hypothetical protein